MLIVPIGNASVKTFSQGKVRGDCHPCTRTDLLPINPIVQSDTPGQLL
jgi:hypothetical protein